MTQFARPSATDSAGNWTPSGAPTLQECMDEVVANDSTDAAVVNEIGSEIFTISLGAVTDPASSIGHSVDIRFTEALGAVIWNFELLCGVTSIATWTDTTAVANIFQTKTYNLTGLEADAITNYGTLKVKVIANGFFLGVLCQVTQIFFSCPDAGASAVPFYDIYLWARPDE